MIAKKKDEEEVLEKEMLLKVDIKGEVNIPGIYSLPSSARVIDQTCTIMIQKLNLLFARNPLNIKGI